MERVCFVQGSTASRSMLRLFKCSRFNASRSMLCVQPAIELAEVRV